MRPGRGVPRLSLRVVLGADIAIGPGKADLLECIAATGSIAAAGRRMGMSYKRAWLLVDTMNRCFRAPLVAAEKGGSSGGGAQLTPLGADVLALYRAIEAGAAKAVRTDLAAIHRRLRGSSPVRGAARPRSGSPRR